MVKVAGGLLLLGVTCCLVLAVLSRSVETEAATDVNAEGDRVELVDDVDEWLARGAPHTGDGAAELTKDPVNPAARSRRKRDFWCSNACKYQGKTGGYCVYSRGYTRSSTCGANYVCQCTRSGYEVEVGRNGFRLNTNGK